MNLWKIPIVESLECPLMQSYFLFIVLHLQDKFQETNKHCGDYVAKHFLAIDWPMAQNIVACCSLKNMF